MMWACYLHDTGVQKLTLNMLCLFLTSPGEGRPQHYITIDQWSQHYSEMRVQKYTTHTWYNKVWHNHLSFTLIAHCWLGEWICLNTFLYLTTLLVFFLKKLPFLWLDSDMATIIMKKIKAGAVFVTRRRLALSVLPLCTLSMVIICQCINIHEISKRGKYRTLNPNFIRCKRRLYHCRNFPKYPMDVGPCT